MAMEVKSPKTKSKYKLIFDGIEDINISDFFEKDFINWASYDNIRSLSSYVDGLKYTSRKVVYALRKLNITEKKVTRLSAKVGELTEYPHGDDSINGVIINMASKYTGGNNLNVLLNAGAFGTRLVPDAAAPRYISSGVTKLLNLIFRPEDDLILSQLVFEGVDIEYKNFAPTIPLHIINGCKNPSVGFSQRILPRHPLDVIKYLKYLLGEVKTKPKVLPYFDGWEGTLTQQGPKTFTMTGKWVVKGKIVYISELPIKFTQASYNKLLMSLEAPVKNKKAKDGENIQPKVQNFFDLCDTKLDKFRYKVILSDVRHLKSLQLEQTVTEVIYCVDENNKVRAFDTVEDVIEAFFKLKMESMVKRKTAVLTNLYNNIKISTSKYRFIDDYLNGVLILNKKSKDEIIEQLKLNTNIVTVDGKYDYLLAMPISSLTLERYNKLKSDIQALAIEYKALEGTTEAKLYLKDLNELEQEIKKLGY